MDSMESSIIAFNEAITSLENELSILFQIEDPISDSLADKTSQLVSITVDSLRLKLKQLIISMERMYSLASDKSQGIDSKKVDLLIEESFIRLFLKMTLLHNCNVSTATIVLKSLHGKETSSLLESLLESVLENARKK